MALGDYLSSLDLAPGVADRLTSTYGPPGPNDGPFPPPVDPYGAPTPEEMQRYGASPADIAAAQRANGPAAAAGNPTNPVVADPKWDPAVEQRKGNEIAGEKERAAATPQGPAGPDGFPTYRDLSNTGSAMQPAAPAGPMRVVPGGWQNSSRSETRQQGFDPDELVDGQYHRDVGAGQNMLAADKHLEAEQQRGMADAVYAASRAAASKAAADQMQRIDVQREQYVEQQKAKLNQMALAAQEKIDPDAAKGGLGAQIFSALAVAMGQFGASLNGGTNTALAIVNGNIDRRIAAQRDNIANAGKALDRETSLYKDNLAEFGDKQRATLATKVAYLDQAKAMADGQYALAKSTANEGQYHALVAGIEEQRAKAADDFAKLTHTQVATQGSQTYRPAQVTGGAGGAGMKGKDALYVPTLGGYARDAETARKLNTHGAMRTQINEDLHEMHGLLTEAKGLNSVTDYGRMQEVRQRIDALRSGVLQKTTVLAEQGAMSKGDQSIAEVRSGLESVDPQLKTGAQIERMQKGLVSVAKSHQRDARLEGESHGIQLGREGYVQGASGPEARAQLQGQNKVVTKKTEGVDDLIEKPKGVTK